MTDFLTGIYEMRPYLAQVQDLLMKALLSPQALILGSPRPTSAQWLMDSGWSQETAARTFGEKQQALKIPGMKVKIDWTQGTSQDLHCFPLMEQEDGHALCYASFPSPHSTLELYGNRNAGDTVGVKSSDSSKGGRYSLYTKFRKT